jgi:hypothetical protein
MAAQRAWAAVFAMVAERRRMLDPTYRVRR